MTEEEAMERRAFSRVPLQAVASLDLPDGSVALGPVENLSMSGVSFETLVDCAPETRGRVAVVFGSGPDAVVVRGTGRVAWTAPGRIAVEFVEVELDGYHHLQNLVLFHGDDPSVIQEEIEAHVGIKRA